MKRDLQYEKRPTNMNRDQHTKRGSNDASSVKKDLHTWKETYKHVQKETQRVYETSQHIYEKRPVCVKKRPTYMRRDLDIWKESYLWVPTCMRNETYTQMIRGLYV